MGLHGSDARTDDPAAGDRETAVFGPYRLEGLLGRGGMGEVHRAFDTRRHRVVALKLLAPQVAGDGDFAARFRREARLAARLRDPHVVPIHDFGEVDGRLFLDMRLVEGTDLAALLTREHRLVPARAVHVVSQVAAALDAAHRDGLVHRDVKPSNVLMTPDDHVYLTDFGIARSTDATALTGTGTAVGTIHYMAPERFLHGRGDQRIDVYSLGCVLHEVLTGRRPFDGDEVAAQMYAHVHLPPPRPSALVAGLPPAFDEVVDRAMAKDPAQRFETPGALAAAARSALAAQPPGPVPTPGPAPTLRAHPLGTRPLADVPPGPPAHDPWRRRALVAAGVAAASLAAAAVAVGTVLTGPDPGTRAAGGTSAQPGVPPVTAAAPTADTPSALAAVDAPSSGGPPSTTAASSGARVRLGQSVREGQVEVTVNAARYADSVDVGNDFAGFKPLPAGEGARYVVVEATVFNDTADSISPGCGGGLYTAVLDRRARRFEPINENSQVRGNLASCVPAVQPGFTAKLTWVYKVPARLEIVDFVFRDQSAYKKPDATSPGVALGLPPT